MSADVEAVVDVELLPVFYGLRTIDPEHEPEEGADQRHASPDAA
jgi:hypothetical protein